MNSILEIHRTEQWANKARAIKIYINGKQVDTIRDGEVKSIKLTEEKNEVVVKIDWCKTKPLIINSSDNSIVKLELGSNLIGWKFFIGLWYIIFKTSDYLYLKHID